MAIINQKELSYYCVSVETRQLAEIQSQADGDAAVAILDDYDRKLLFSAVNAYSKKEGISVSKIAEDIGVGRTYLYSLLESDQIELNRLTKLQDYLGINIISESAVYLYLQFLNFKLTGKQPDFRWQEECIEIEVPRYYLMEFLIPGIKRCVNQWEYYLSISKDYDKNRFGSPVSSDNMISNKLIEFCENNLTGSDWTKIVDNFSTSHKDEYFSIPISPGIGYWLALEEEIPDDIEKDIQCQINDAEKITSKKEDLIEIKSWLEEEKDLLINFHNKFFKKVFDQRTRVESWAEVIKEYCSKNNRILKREPEYPLEIERVANNLEENTLPAKEKKAKSK
tara:strand:- start:6 stop:1019 length:1014 start_codon:yes stop_codon:yes gene_type:complete